MVVAAISAKASAMASVRLLFSIKHGRLKVDRQGSSSN
jgi:hypothetical protein